MRHASVILIFVLSFFFLLFNFSYSYDPFYAHSYATDAIRSRYQEGKSWTLIIPGHSPGEGGTSFFGSPRAEPRGYYERDLNVKLSHYLAEYLRADPKSNLFVARDQDGSYASWLRAYMETFRGAITDFRNRLIREIQIARQEGTLAPPSPVYHNRAGEQASFELYAINKFANDNKIDIALHIHLNDYGDRPSYQSGEYSGFAVYVPDPTLPNAASSIELGEAIRDRLDDFVPVSDLPGEHTGVVKDSELIAIGSNASRDGPSVLIEYGYIYEPQFRNATVREVYFKELAYQTAQAIFGYVRGTSTPTTVGATVLPHHFGKTLKRGLRSDSDVLALQFALRREGLYPSTGRTLSDCPISGNFGPCTEAAVKRFQEKYRPEVLVPAGLSSGTGFVGPLSLGKLNTLYGLR